MSSQTNLSLASYALRYYERFGTPIFPQAEVGRIIEGQHTPIVGETAFCSTVDLWSDEYIRSDEVARLQKHLCDETGWTRVLVVASYPHAHRACWIYERLGFEVIIPPALPKMQFERSSAKGVGANQSARIHTSYSLGCSFSIRGSFKRTTKRYGAFPFMQNSMLSRSSWRQIDAFGVIAVY